ncbi:family 1 extracellular solute-binding protein [Deinococcus aerius]|uniref:Family 1 extracellular solute-binding protein n=1 Tax=Deinococcus aerius TaxID=200253 RepID=A0A2I9CXE2_9DEIO|nr:ABC transporter substrate-binding protein [Deinococcus aerius]GBF06742.1 family 1 extracellular solute-binding protein [Deinococcus aerius]
MTHSLRRTSLLALLVLGGAGAQTYSGPKVQLTFLHGFTGADRPVMERLIAQFNSAHPNIQVRAQAQPWGTTWQQLPSLVASGRAPDVVVINEDQITQFIARGAVSPLTDAELKAAAINKARFYGPLFKTADYEGKSYGVPISSVAYVMFYNKDLMNKMGITKVPTTRAEFLKAAQQCTADKSGKKAGQAGFDKANLDTWGVSLYNNWVGSRMAYAAILQNGGSLVDKNLNANFNTPQAVEAVQFLVDLVQKHGVARPNSTEEAELAAFSQGKVCFFPSGQWYTDRFEQQKMNFGVAFVPRVGSQKDAAWGGSSHLTLPKQRAGYDANKRRAALEFINWMTLPAQNLTWTEAGSLPTMPAVASNPKFAGRPIAGIFPKLGSIYATSGFPWSGQVLGPFDNAWANAYSGKQSVKAALDAGVSESNKQIQQARKSFQ